MLINIIIFYRILETNITEKFKKDKCENHTDIINYDTAPLCSINDNCCVLHR